MTNLMPIPAKIVFERGMFRLTENFSVGALGEHGDRAQRAAARFMARLARRTGLSLKQDILAGFEDAGRASLVIKSERPGKLIPGEDESYGLTIAPDRVTLLAMTDIGILRGFETILQLVAADAQGYVLPAARIEDRPRFPWRGLLIDAGRHFMPLDVIKRNLDGMAAVKMNVLHWHLSEDQGFRLESKTFPELVRLGSDGFYYTQEQVREVIVYAADRGIRVMPEFDIPGHSTSWLVAFPKLASAPGPYRIERAWGVFDPTFNPADENVYRFFGRFFEEMARLFPDPYVHIGGDENNGKQWDANPSIQKFKAERGFKDNHALQAYFNGRILQILTKHGKTMVGWDEIFQPGLPTNIVIQSWRGKQALFDAAKKGYRSLLSNGYYIDLCQPASAHYANDPLPNESELTIEERNLVLGGEATMWSELVSPETIDSRIWPRTGAIAERLWSPAEVIDVEDMYRRLDALAVALEDAGLMHIKNQEMMLRRLAGTAEIAPLKAFVDVIEPVKKYARYNQGVTYTQLSPLTRIVDAAQPESRAARLFGRAVDEFLRTQSPHTAAALAAELREWEANVRRLRPLLLASPALGEVEPLARDLAVVSALGLRALDFLAAGMAGTPDWANESRAALDEARKPKGHAELAVVSAIERLVTAALAR